MKVNSFFAKLLLILCCSWYSSLSLAGILAERTRVIYPEAQRVVSLMLSNTNDYPIISQVWVDDGTGNPDTAKAPFIVLPPIFKLKGGQSQGIRILQTDTQLPQNRESLFWLNLYEVPMLEKKQLEGDYLRTSTNTQLKLIFRPKNIPNLNVEQINQQLKFKANGQKLAVSNNSAHYISLASLQLHSNKGMMSYSGPEHLMLEPKKIKIFDFNYSIDTAQKLSVKYVLIDDLGNHHVLEKSLN